VGYVFQGFALFPHLTVTGNVASGCATARARSGTRARAEVLARLGLEPLAQRYPR
jgi:ABC-type sulfate/molybdate transport systems ATPase subunit